MKEPLEEIRAKRLIITDDHDHESIVLSAGRIAMKGEGGVTRILAGIDQDGTVWLELCDGKGKPRAALLVDKENGVAMLDINTGAEEVGDYVQAVVDLSEPEGERASFSVGFVEVEGDERMAIAQGLPVRFPHNNDNEK